MPAFTRTYCLGSGRRAGSTAGALWCAVLLLVATACAQGPEVVVHGSGEPARVRVEVVNTPAARAQGLMYRKELGADAGMLFVFPREEPLQFWMKNTLISLDMIFIDGKGHVVGVVANAKPMSEKGVGPSTPALYVLEVNAGFAARHGIDDGAQVDFERVPAGAR